MTDPNNPDQDELPVKPPGLSWRAMLALVALAILVAAGFAYLLVNPFFHQQPR